MHQDCWREVQIPKALREYTTGAFENRILGLSRLNVFIGPNNSGKSRLLRALFHETCLFVTGHDGQGDVADAISRLTRLISKLPVNLRQRQEALNHLAKCVPGYRTDSAGANTTFTGATNEAEFSHNSFAGGPHILDQWLTEEDKREVLNFSRIIENNSRKHLFRNTDIKKIDVYIPSIRGLRTPQNHKTYWNDRTNSDYFAPQVYEGLKLDTPSTSLNAVLVTGFEVYELLKRHLLGTLDQRQLVADFEAFLSRAFFDEQPVAIIPRLSPEELYVKIGKSEERPIFDLGDGIQQIIIQTLPIFLFKEGSLRLFIEEPELYIHPGFQRLLIDAFLEDEGRALQVFVATHSHQFMDITVDTDMCSVYKITKEHYGAPDQVVHKEKFNVVRSSSSDFDALKLPGVRNSSVLLSNCTIWVEGITDRLYLRRYIELVLAKIGSQMREDIEYSFVEYSGNNITHWSFLDESTGIDAKRLCGPLFIIVDGDGPSKDKRCAELGRILGTNVLRLPVREIENLLTPEGSRSHRVFGY